MPMASDELRDLMKEYFGDPVGDSSPCEFLEAAGYELTRDWEWKPRAGVKDYADMTQQEFNCLLFLRDEWDYGLLILENQNDNQ